MSAKEEWCFGSGDVLRFVLHWMRGGKDPEPLREFLAYVQMSDAFQVEHVILIQGLKNLVDSDRPLTLEELEGEIHLQDPAGFARMVMLALLEDNRGLVGTEADGFAWLRGRIGKCRETREIADLEGKREAVKMARRVIEGKVGILEAAQALCLADRSFVGVDGWRDGLFSGLLSMYRLHPRGSVRACWNVEALAEMDENLECELREMQSEVETACRLIVGKWGGLEGKLPKD